MFGTYLRHWQLIDFVSPSTTAILYTTSFDKKEAANHAAIVHKSLKTYYFSKMALGWLD